MYVKVGEFTLIFILLRPNKAKFYCPIAGWIKIRFLQCINTGSPWKVFTEMDVSISNANLAYEQASRGTQTANFPEF